MQRSTQKKWAQGKHTGKPARVWIAVLGIGVMLLFLACNATAEEAAEAEPNAASMGADIGGSKQALPEEFVGDYGEGVAEAFDEQMPERPEREDRYDEFGNLLGYAVYEYDALDRMTLEEHFDLDGRSETRWERSYSEDGRVETTLLYDRDVFSMKMVSTYDENNMLTELRNYDVSGMLFSVTDYDAAGCPTSQRFYTGAPGAEWVFEEHVFDAAGELIEDRSYREDGTLDTIRYAEFDENNRQTRSLIVDANGVVQIDNRFYYDENGNIARTENYDENGALKSYSEDERDQSGRILRNVHYDANGKVNNYWSYEYAVDGRISRTEYYNGEDVLEYYSDYRYEADGSYTINTCEPTGEFIQRIYYDADGNFIRSIEAN